MLKDWYVIYINSRLEKRVYNDLSKRDVRCLLPMQMVVRQWSDRKKKMMVPLFPNYLFVQVGRADWLKVLSHPNVIKFISINGVPSPVNEEEISLLMKIMKGEPQSYDEDIVLGEMVRVNSGPMAGIEGLVIKKTSKQKLVVRIESLNRYVLIEIPGYNLEKMVLS